MKKILFLLFAVLSFFASWAQPGSTQFSAIRSRVTDSTTVSFPTGYGVMYYYTGSGKWIFCNAENDCREFGTGTGGGGSGSNYKYPIELHTSNFTLAKADTAHTLVLNSGSTITIDLDDFSSGPDGMTFSFYHKGAGDVTIDANGETITGSAGNTDSPGQGNFMYMVYDSASNAFYLGNGTASGGGGGTWGSITGTLSDQTDLQTALDGKVNDTGNETIAGTKTFSSTIVGSINGNAATVTTNANLTGDVTSSGNATTIANNAVTFGKMQAITDNRLLGAQGGTAVEEISLTGNDFDLGSNTLSIDYTNGQKATTSVPGFLTDTDWDTFNGKMTNPMTTAGDLVYGGVSGAPTRLALGAANAILGVNSGATNVEWKTTSGGAAVTANNGPFTVSLGGSSINGAVNAFSIGVTPTGVSSVADGDVVVGDGTNTNAAINVLNTTRTANWHLKAGTATAQTAPLKQTNGTLLTTPESGAMEMSSGHYATTNTLNRFALGGPIADYFADVQNSTTTETDFFSYTTKASTLVSNGEKLVAVYSGTFNDATTVTATMKAYFAGTQIGSTGALNVTATGSWTMRVVVIRSGTTTARAFMSFSGLGISYDAEADLTGITFTNTNIIKITAQAGGAGGGSNDITAKLGYISWYGAASN